MGSTPIRVAGASIAPCRGQYDALLEARRYGLNSPYASLARLSPPVGANTTRSLRRLPAKCDDFVLCYRLDQMPALHDDLG